MSVSTAASTIASGEAASMLQHIYDFYMANNETIVTVLLALNVFLCALNVKINWPIGIIAVTAYGFNSWFIYGLYADAVLQTFYFITGFYGWWYWWKGGENKKEAKISDLNFLGWVGSISLVAAGTFFVGFFLDVKTDSVVPYLDAYTTVICLLAQIMLMLRVRSAWIFWIAANVVYVYMFHLKGLDQLALLYVGFIANACLGFFIWTKAKKAGK